MEQQFGMRVRLYTRDGGFVHEATIPPFMTPPEAILWGARTFILGQPKTSFITVGPATIYTEGLLYVLIDGATSLPF